MKIRPQKFWGLTLIWISLVSILVIESQTSGSGWLSLLAAALGGVGTVAAWTPAILLLLWRRKAQHHILHSPSDAVVGQPMNLYLDVGRWAYISRILPNGVMSTGRNRLIIRWVPQQRGVLRSLPIEITNGAPLSTYVWSIRWTATLDPPVTVAPAPLAGTPPGYMGPEQIPMQIRDWEAGDPIKNVHWASSTRVGHLVVRSGTDQGVLTHQDIKVLLYGDATSVEQQVRVWAYAIARRLNTGGLRVTSRQPDGYITQTVQTNTQVGRILATAIAEPISEE